MKTKGNRKSKILKNTINKNKTIKKSNKIKSCNEFCKNVYVYEIDKQNKELAKGSNVAYNPKIGRDFRISTCKKNFCNKNCKKTYKYYDKESEKLFTPFYISNANFYIVLNHIKIIYSFI